jgi:hypothetical protein
MTTARLLEGSGLGAAATTRLMEAFERVSAAERETWRDPRRALLERIAELGDASLAPRLEPSLTDYDSSIATQAAALLAEWTGRSYVAAPRPLPREPVPTPAEYRVLDGARVVLSMRGGGEIVIELWPFLATTNVFRFALIGSYIPSIKDRLVNLIQLSAAQESALAYASIQQKTLEFEPVSFASVIRLNQNKKHLKYLLIPVTLILVLMIFNGSVITQSTHRLVNFNQKFSPQAPFQFVVTNTSLIAFFNEDFTLKILLEGSAIPENAYLVIDGQRLKLETLEPGSFQYTFEKLQQAKSFQIEAAGFFSDSYQIVLANRPEVTQLKVDLQYPRYLQRKNQELTNAGNLEVPEGTLITWRINTAHAQEASILFSSDMNLADMQSTDNQTFLFKRFVKDPEDYEVFLQNENSRNRERISYHIDVLKDQFPQLTVSNFKDSVLYQRIVLGGLTADDYGITQLNLQFHVKDAQQKVLAKSTVPIPIASNQTQQSFFFNWNLDTLKLKPGHQLEYFL